MIINFYKIVFLSLVIMYVSCSKSELSDNSTKDVHDQLSSNVEITLTKKGNITAKIKSEILNGEINDINLININASSDDPNNDDFSYTSGSYDFSGYNGTENNGSVLENKYPDSEDYPGTNEDDSCKTKIGLLEGTYYGCLLYTSPSPRDS